MNAHRILLVGLGNLGAQILDLLVRLSGSHSFLIGGKNLDYLHQRTNLSLLAALQLGYTPDISYAFMDLWNVDQTAEIITQFQPDIIICTATLARWEVANHLPVSLAERLASAQMGPRLPFHLTLVYKLMQAVHASGQATIVINAIYPDVVNPILGKVGLTPTTGIGDLANNIPAVRKSIALRLNTSIEHVEIQLVMARYVSYWMSRTSVADAPFHFTVLVNGENVTHLLNKSNIFTLLPTTFKRIGGSTGLLMTATSAAVVIEGIMKNTHIITHAPGPNGLSGGYPVRVDRQGVTVALPDDLSLEAAIQINEAGLHLDGIEKIDNDGTVFFTEDNMVPYKEILGYSCQRMPLVEVEHWAKELQAKYHALAEKYQ